MRRIAIFVEGQTELIFVREMLLKWFEYNIDVECRTLFSANQFLPAEYDSKNPTANTHFQLINVGMDGNVLSRMLQREGSLFNAGYDTLIGLRDMYSEEYKNRVKNRIVDTLVNNRFKSGAEDTIQEKSSRPESLSLCFAIMELEAWWIGIPTLWTTLDLTVKEKHQDFFSTPESVFHPAGFIKTLFQSQEKTYTKRKNEVESIVGNISREDYLDLHSSQRCPSFCEFVQYIQPHENNL